LVAPCAHSLGSSSRTKGWQFSSATGPCLPLVPRRCRSVLGRPARADRGRGRAAGRRSAALGGDLILARRRAPDRFDAVRGKADIRWRTDELMALLRGDD